MSKNMSFEVGQPMPLGHRRATVNSEQADASLERIATRVAEMIAPTIAEAVAQELQAQGVTTNAGSNGRKITDAYTLPDGDQWAGVDLNDAIDGRNDRKPGTLDEYGFPDELRGDLDAYQLPD
ncbi:MAG: hypothetical protein ACQEUM_02620 [Pseudomonadota bacterium]